jgi:hypothetical protein
MPVPGGERWWEVRLVRYNDTQNEVLGVVIDVTTQRKKNKKNGG